MAYIYRYTDLTDNIIKYVGIVWSNNRVLQQRLEEHLKNDEWCDGNYKIEYICENINTRTDAEYFEAHYISLYKTDRYFNCKKVGWGTSNFLPNKEKEWKEYIVPEEIIKNLTCNKSIIKNTKQKDDTKLTYKEKAVYSVLYECLEEKNQNKEVVLTIEEMASECGTSRGTIIRIIKELERKKYIEKIVRGLTMPNIYKLNYVL
jgi:predicted DNA-binding transcriptional regulator AlpA